MSNKRSETNPGRLTRLGEIVYPQFDELILFLIIYMPLLTVLFHIPGLASLISAIARIWEFDQKTRVEMMMVLCMVVMFVAATIKAAKEIWSQRVPTTRTKRHGALVLYVGFAALGFIAIVQMSMAVETRQLPSGPERVVIGVVTFWSMVKAVVMLMGAKLESKPFQYFVNNRMHERQYPKKTLLAALALGAVIITVLTFRQPLYAAHSVLAVSYTLTILWVCSFLTHLFDRRRRTSH